MFTNKKILSLQKEIKTLSDNTRKDWTDQRVVCDWLTDRVKELSAKFDTLQSYVNNEIIKQDNIVERRLLMFHKEITDKYFSTLERILKVHSETSMITVLANQTNQKDLANLRTTLLKPFIEEKWRQDEIEKSGKADSNIQSLGQKLVSMRKEFHEQMLKDEREEKSIDEFRGKISILNMIIGDTI